MAGAGAAPYSALVEIIETTQGKVRERTCEKLAQDLFRKAAQIREISAASGAVLEQYRAFGEGRDWLGETYQWFDERIRMDEKELAMEYAKEMALDSLAEKAESFPFGN